MRSAPGLFLRPGAAFGAAVGIRAIVPADAFTAENLGTERTGNGVFIRDVIVLTIGLGGQLWSATILKECLSFPAGKHDDIVDALGLIGQMLEYLQPAKPDYAIYAVTSDGRQMRTGMCFNDILKRHSKRRRQMEMR